MIVSQLLDEIERVVAKRERWREYAKIGNSQSNFAPSIYMMTLSINAAKASLLVCDPSVIIKSIEDLKGYDNE